jgi:hypothetical protein
MSHTFQDAIKVTGALGQRCLWIDLIASFKGSSAITMKKPGEWRIYTMTHIAYSQLVVPLIRGPAFYYLDQEEGGAQLFSTVKTERMAPFTSVAGLEISEKMCYRAVVQARMRTTGACPCATYDILRREPNILGV